mgnify:CR=1 FL=1|tara:strand:- start:182 stop:1054 length:873 start_codon:yes stop_codon:yes gene_type:complete
MRFRSILIVAGIVGLLAAAVGFGYWAGQGKGSSDSSAQVSQAVKSAPKSTPQREKAAKELLAAGEKSASSERWKDARRLFLQVLQEYADTTAAVKAQERLGDVNIKLLFIPGPASDTPFYKAHKVQTGDTLGKLARRFHTTVTLLQRANRLQSDKILLGQVLRVPTVKMSVIVDKSLNTLALKADEEILKVYTISTGRGGNTPVGKFTIETKVVDPPWYTAQGVIPSDSPKNVLGSRWLGFSETGYGIHGTVDPDSIGQPVTAGCVRMYNKDVEELYKIVPLKTEVTVVE